MFDIPTAALITGLFVAYLVQNTFVFDTITTYLFIILLFGFLHITSYGEEQSACQKMQKISIYSAERFAKGVIPLGAAVVVSLLFNIRFIHAAESIVSMLKQANTNRVEEVLQEYDRAVAYSMLSATEARIQLFNMSVQAEQNYAFSKTDYLMLLDKAIEESRQEISRRTSQNVRVRITLAKLLQLRFVFTGNEDDFESSWAMYRESIGIAPHFPPAYIGIAETYLAAGQTVQAADAVDYIYREITKPNALVYPVLLVSVQGSNFDRAIRVLDYQKSLGGIPRHPRKAFLDPQKMLLVIERSFTSDDYEGRKKFLEHMLQSRGDFFETKIDSAYLYISLAETEKQLGNTEQARAAIVQYQQDVPDDSIFVENYLKEL
jgi:tetratricopeptide (TPR) repeat protein